MNTPIFDLDEHVATKDIAKRTGTSSRLWDGYRSKGGGPSFIRISKRCIRYRWGDVVEWLEAKKVDEVLAVKND